MFVRIRDRKLKEGTSQYAYLVDNRWSAVRKKHEQRIVACLGNVATLPVDGTLEKIICALDTFAKKQGFASLANGVILSDLTDEAVASSTSEYGSLLLSRHVLSRLSVVSTVERLSRRYTANVSLPALTTTLTALIAHHLTPKTDVSERATWQWYTNEVFIPHKPELFLPDFYRTLDFLGDHKNAIEMAYFETNRDLFSQVLDLVLFDTTSIYYYGADDPTNVYPETDLLQYGFSKDGKGSLKQLIVGVLMTSSGVPIAHEVFPGNMADVTSFASVIKTVKDKYKLSRVVLVADRGMVSEENLLMLEEIGIGYILGVRMRTLPRELAQHLLDDLTPKDMDKVNDHLFTQQYYLAHFSPQHLKDWFIDKILKGRQVKKLPTLDEVKIKEHLLKRRLFTFLNPQVKKATEKKRQHFTTIIKKKILTTTDKEWVVKNGYRKYLSFAGGINPTLAEDKLEAEELFDGKWVLITNTQDISPVEAGRYYQTLQFVERGFHDLKSLISVRPVFHFTERRIKAHIFVAFLTLIVKWYICRILNPNSLEDGRRFIETMTKLRAVAVDERIPVYLRTVITPQTQVAMKKLEMKVPGKVLLDGRLKPNAVSHQPGRPRKDRQQAWQLRLAEVTVLHP